MPRATGEMCRGRSGDGDRIGGVFLSCSDIGVASAADRVEVERRIVGDKLGGRKQLHHTTYTTRDAKEIAKILSLLP